jgi:hypothetical protein
MFELELAAGDREAAEAWWRRAEAVTPIWSERSIAGRPAWQDRRGVALSEVGHHLIAQTSTTTRRRGAELLVEALAWVEPQLQRDLATATKRDHRGFVYRTVYGNGLAAEWAGDLPRAHALHLRARDVYRTLVTDVGSTTELDDAIARTAPRPPESPSSPAGALVELLVAGERMRLATSDPTPRLLDDLSRCLEARPTVAQLVELLVEHPDVDELFASDDDLERLLAEFV